MTKPSAGPSPHGWHSGDDCMFRCEKEFVFKHLRKIGKAGIRETPRAKAIGLLTHAGRARWFRDGFLSREKGWDSIYAAVKEEAERQPLPIPLGAEQEALSILTQYVDHYGKLPKPRVLAAELELGPFTTYPHSDELHTIRLDDLSIYPDFGNAAAIGEMKTTGGPPNAVYAHYNSNHGQLLKQMLMVTEAIRQGKLKADKTPIGIVLDVVQKGYGGKPCKFERSLVTIEPYQLDWFNEELERRRQRRRGLEVLENQANDPKLHRWARNSELGMECRVCSEDIRHRWHNVSPAPSAHRNPTACRRLVSGDGGQFIAVDCEYAALCKFGRASATEYVVNGQPGAVVKGEWWR